MSDHEALAASLEAASEGSRDLSNDVLLALGWKWRGPNWRSIVEWTMPDGRGPIEYGPCPTTSIDDGLALLQERGWTAMLDTKLNRVQIDALAGGRVPGKACTLELALCAAIVRAAGQEKGGE